MALSKEEILKLIEKRNTAIRKEYEERYGRPMIEETRVEREKRIFETPQAWERIG